MDFNVRFCLAILTLFMICGTNRIFTKPDDARYNRLSVNGLCCLWLFSISVLVLADEGVLLFFASDGCRWAVSWVDFGGVS